MNRISLLPQFRGGVALLGYALILSSAAAQTDNLLDDESTETNRLPYVVSSSASEQFQSSVDAGGSMSIGRVNAGVSVPFRLTDTLVLGTSFKYGLEAYDFGGLPEYWHHAWDNINTYNVATVLRWKVDDQWSVYVGGFVRESGEEGAEFKKGISGGGMAGVGYKVSDKLTLGFGVGAASQLEEHASVLPLITADWKFADQWCFKLGLTDTATAGYGAQITYDLSRNWQLGVGFQHQTSRFRIEGDPYDVVSSGHIYRKSIRGIGQNESSALYVEATWHALSKLDVLGFAGAVLGGRLELDNQHGTEITSSDYSAAGILGLKTSLQF